MGSLPKGHKASLPITTRNNLSYLIINPDNVKDTDTFFGVRAEGEQLFLLNNL